MSKITGIVIKAHRGQGKGSYDYIVLQDRNGNTDEYRIYTFPNPDKLKEFKEKIVDIQKEVTLWYQDWWFLESYKEIRELRVDGELVQLGGKIYFQYNYKDTLNWYNKLIPNLLWWLNYSLFGWLWLWYLNRKELPIHRLNKRKRYKKYNLKDK
jgi:hypothetical protein